MENAEKCGLHFQGFQIIADDLNADSTAECSQPAWQILYTTHLQSSSPCIVEMIFLQFRSINS